MPRHPPTDPPRLRQRILGTEEARRDFVQVIVAERGPMIRGSFVRQGRRCGKPGCRCTRGELHEAAFLSVSEGGRIRNTHVPRADRAQVEKKAARYRSFRRARAQLAALGREVLKEADALQRALTEPYPPPEREREGRGRFRGKGK